MKKFLIIAACALTLAGCAGANKSIFEGGSSLTATIQTPVGPVDLYRVMNVYDGALKVANEYRAYCYSKSYAVIVKDRIMAPLCSHRRSVVNKLQAADDKAFAAIQTAQKFIAENPTISAVSVISSAWAAVSDYQALATPYVPQK